MIVAGIVAEYDPFHQGHAWHVAQTRRQTGCDYVVACMDGHFTQRGEPALVSRWNRARMALSCGVDAVFELPTLYAARTADVFARSAVSILGGLGVDVISFGCEVADRGVIEALARIREDEPEAVSRMARERLDAGRSHAAAWGEAAAKYLGVPAGTLNQPNLILAAEYVRALRAGAWDMDFLPVPRRGDYHGAALGEYASATALRAAVARGDVDAARACIPEAARPCFIPEALHPMDDLLLYRLRELSPEQLAALPDMAEGLEMRLWKLCRETAGREALLEALKCKRYTRARLSRMLFYALAGLTACDAQAFPKPPYARLVGIRRAAEPLLKALKARSTLPVASNPSEIRDDPVFRFECRATDLWSLFHDDPALRLPGREFRERFVRL